MATDTSLLEGEVSENPIQQELNVEKMLFGFLRALLEEQTGRSVKSETEAQVPS